LHLEAFSRGSEWIAEPRIQNDLHYLIPLVDRKTRKATEVKYGGIINVTKVEGKMKFASVSATKKIFDSDEQGWPGISGCGLVFVA